MNRSTILASLGIALFAGIIAIVAAVGSRGNETGRVADVSAGARTGTAQDFTEILTDEVNKVKSGEKEALPGFQQELQKQSKSKAAE